VSGKVSRQAAKTLEQGPLLPTANDLTRQAFFIMREAGFCDDHPLAPMTLELGRRFDQHLQTSVPGDSSTNDELSLLRAEVMEYDTFAMGVISSVLAGLDVDEEYLHPDEELSKRIRVLKLSASREDLDLIEEYLEYKERIDSLLRVAAQVSQKRVGGTGVS
jgi:hypothetical protein